MAPLPDRIGIRAASQGGFTSLQLTLTNNRNWYGINATF